jgi:hypothetical protein
LKVVANAQRLCVGLQKYGYKVVTGGTDVHLLLVDFRSAGITGARAEKILEDISIACNKNTGKKGVTIICVCKFSVLCLLTACYLLYACFFLGIFLNHEDGGDMLLCSIGRLSLDCMALHHRR